MRHHARSDRVVRSRHLRRGLREPDAADVADAVRRQAALSKGLASTQDPRGWGTIGAASRVTGRQAWDRLLNGFGAGQRPTGASSSTARRGAGRLAFRCPGSSTTFQTVGSRASGASSRLPLPRALLRIMRLRSATGTLLPARHDTRLRQHTRNRRVRSWPGRPSGPPADPGWSSA